MAEAVILLVDDEKTILDSLRGQLRNLFGRRFDYEAAENADEAWEVIDELHQDEVKIVVIVSDWLMPGTRGDEFLIRVCKSHPQIGRIMLTGQAPPDAIERVQTSACVTRVLHKPWTADGLAEAIEDVIQTATG